MPNVRSSWRFTYDPAGVPLVILEINDRLSSEIRWGSQRGGETVPLLDAVAPFLRDSGNRVINVSYDRMEPETDHAAVCKAVMTRLISHGGLVKKPLKIEAVGVAECYWLADACLVPSLEAGLRVIGTPEMATRYSLVFTALTEIPTAATPLVPTLPTPFNPGDFPAGATMPDDPGGFLASSADPNDPGGFLAAGLAARAPGDFPASAATPDQPGLFSGVDADPSDPGGFLAAELAARAPGDFPATTPTPVAPGDFT